MEGQKHQEQAAQERAGRRWAWLLPRAAVALLAVVAAVVAAVAAVAAASLR